jgi:NADPH:quinone reductase-like Zn-dependent oxidoreductase
MTISSAEFKVPDRMRAAVIDHFGDPEDVMHIATIPVPEIGDDEVLIHVDAAGVAVWDHELCGGAFGGDGQFPRVLGSDGAGTIVGMGPEARRFNLRDRVYAWGFLNPKGGFFAEYAVLPEEDVSVVPSSLSTEEAAVLAVDGLTALAGLDQVETRRGQNLMILGASGGVGHLAIQLAKRFGARVFAVASGADGLALVRRVGADAAIDGRDPASDLAAAAHAFAPDGLDAALVLASGDAVSALSLVRPGGRIAYANGVEPEPRGLPGVEVEAFDGYSGHEALDRLNRMVEIAPFHVEVSREFSLDAAPEAVRAATRHHIGKLALHIS